MRLNIGCGMDYREGFVNIDGSEMLPRVDRVIDLSTEKLCDHFTHGTFEQILAHDIIEHHFHWEAVGIMHDCHNLLKSGGHLDIRVPDADYIIGRQDISISRKITLLFGGQDVSQGNNPAMERSRKKFPQFFCHKYAWTMKAMRIELLRIGFSTVECKRAGNNFVVRAAK
jgi:hypothetical protein